MKRTLKHVAAFCALSLVLLSSVSCKNRKALLPNVNGKAGEVIVVMDRELWEGELGVQIRRNMACDCEFLPQPEPLYSLINIAPGAFSTIFRTHRNIIFFNVDPRVTEPGVVFRSDVWASPQCLVTVNATDGPGAELVLSENMQKILSFVEQAERDRIIANSIRYEEKAVRPAVEEVFGGSPVFPKGYVLRKRTGDFAWIAYETTYTNQAVLVYKYPARGDNGDFDKAALLDSCSRVLRDNVPGMFDGSYMIINRKADPSVEYMSYRGMEFAQIRGLWEVQNDFMGGPFVCHCFYSRDGKEIIVLQAFVYAPRYNKRHYLRQVESILYSFRWKE